MIDSGRANRFRRVLTAVGVVVLQALSLAGTANYADAGRPLLLPHDAILYSSDVNDPNPMPPQGFPLSPGKDMDLYLLSTRALEQLTAQVGNDQFAVWSPDGSRIAFEASSAVGPSGVDYDIYVMDADGSDLVRLTDSPAFDAVPAWSPDGSQISFTSFRTGDPEIYVMDADGSDIQRITDAPGWDFAFGNWCPDGRIVFHSNRGQPGLPIEPVPMRTFDVFVMDPDGSDVVRLTDHSDNDDEAVCSPDGSKVAFVSERDEDREIYVMNIDGTEQQRLTFDPGNEHRPAWSPDGTRIAFDTDIDGNLEIYVMHSEGSAVTRLTDDPAYDFHPVFRPQARNAESNGPHGPRNH